jgi:hypothetical protein
MPTPFDPSIPSSSSRLASALVGAAAVVFAAGAGAQDVPAGTVLDAASLATLEGQTFEGHRIADLLPPALALLVREHGLSLTLRPSEPVPLDPRWDELTQRHHGQVQYDPASREISGYVAGVPFPDVQRDAMALADRQEAGTKLLWNFFYGNPQFGNSYEFNEGDILLIDGRKGLERVQRTMDKKFRMVGRLTEPHALGDGSVYKKQVTMILEPYDVRGLGIYFVRYTDGRPDDSYAYIKSVRRIRRISGRTWMDPVGNSDITNDDNDMLDVYPTWYDRYHLLEERPILAVAHGPDTSEHELKDWLDVDTPPYWNPIAQWEPRQVYVIEATPPSFHLYSRKILYMEKDFPLFYLSDSFDRKGERWKVGIKTYHPLTPEESPQPGIGPSGGVFIDLQKYHATFIDGRGFRMNDQAATEADYSLTAIQKMLR